MLCIFHVESRYDEERLGPCLMPSFALQSASAESEGASESEPDAGDMDTDDGTPAKTARKAVQAPKPPRERKDAPTKSVEKPKAASATPTAVRACALASVSTPSQAPVCGEGFEAHLMGLASSSERRPAAAAAEERKAERDKVGPFGRVQPDDKDRYKWLADVRPRAALVFRHAANVVGMPRTLRGCIEFDPALHRFCSRCEHNRWPCRCVTHNSGGQGTRDTTSARCTSQTRTSKG